MRSGRRSDGDRVSVPVLLSGGANSSASGGAIGLCAQCVGLGGRFFSTLNDATQVGVMRVKSFALRAGSTKSLKKPRSWLGAVPLAARRHLTAMVERLPDQGVGPRAGGLS